METTSMLSSIITADLVNGVFTDLLTVIGITIPVVVGGIGLRKGISWLKSALRGI